ncbi:hypothetical protein EPI10_023939 [Gossypium australe]|uniref:Uncharacterized protein n=1 Tax=Gossypium australe TaxID=47621 RepID=A0A5B6VWV4_9ROSI|nr:hypothetical protein EPI10_023939 [Gossypium australe]
MKWKNSEAKLMRTLSSIRKRPSDGTIRGSCQGNLNRGNNCWPFDVIKAYPYGAVGVKDTKTGVIYIVNGQRLKHYWSAHVDRDKQSINLRDV